MDIDIFYWRFRESRGQLLIVEEDNFRVNVVEVSIMEFPLTFAFNYGSFSCLSSCLSIFPQDFPYKFSNS